MKNVFNKMKEWEKVKDREFKKKKRSRRQSKKLEKEMKSRKREMGSRVFRDWLRRSMGKRIYKFDEFLSWNQV
jgi:hypothetical protein